MPKERKNIPGVRIQLTDGKRTFTTYTGADGFFAFENIPPGLYEAVADLPIARNRARVDLREAWYVSWVVFSVVSFESSRSSKWEDSVRQFISQILLRPMS